MNEIQKMTGLLNPLKVLKGHQGQDTRMRFSVEPFAGDSGFTQWHDAMKMCARLPGGIPQEFRRRMWLTLAEQHVRRRNMQWKDVERICFNEWASPDDEGLGDQIVKDLHRTGCSLFCGVEGEVNQVLLKRVLLGYARWNKSVGYCQGFNMLAAIILEVMDRQESDSLKVMIYLIEGVLPESYFANNLRGLSVDMAVFRELLRLHLPILSRHLETLQQEAADQATGACYEPPLTNVFTMQWFLTLFSNCLPKDVVMRVWDLTFLHGNEMLLRTALAIWGKFANRIMEVPTADEFYCVMGNLTREMLTYGLMDANLLVKTLIGMAPFPFPGLATLRDKYNYNITPWTVSSVARKGLKIFYLDDDDDEEEKGDHEDVNHTMAVATAFGLAGILRKTSGHLVPSSGQNMQDGRNSPSHGPHSMRPNLDISQLKKQYERLRERQRQTHVILTASNIRRKSMDEINRLPSLQKTNQITMKHLLRGKKALTTRTKRVVPQGVIPNIINKKKTDGKIADGTVTKNRHSKQSKSSSSANNKSNVGKQKIATNLDGPILQSPIAVSHQQLMPKRSLPEEDQISNIEDIASPAVTIHWKDTPRRVKRRASLPYGVKLMEGPAPPSLPDIKDDTDDDGGSSTSTELCDENLLADLSEEEIVADPAIVRPLSTSPRLENHQDNGNPKERLTELLKEKPRTIIIPDKDAKGKNSDPLISVVKVKPEIILESYAGDLMQPPIINLDEINTGMERIKPPNELNIPHILESLTQPELIGNHNKRSLSSPTKWKWSFSEIENPELVEPVSPILKLHNFSSEEILEEKNMSLPNMTLQPEINIEKETTKVSSPEDDKKQDDQQRSNIFAYLFEITDVSKLSNANSEEPSPIEDLEKKNSPTSNIDKTIAQLLSEDSTTIECDTMVSPTNQYNSNITPYDYEKSEKNINQLMCALNDITIPPITSYNTVTSGTIHGSTTTAETIAEPNNYFNIENETLKTPNLNDKSKENSIDAKFVRDISVATKITYTNIAASSSDTATSFVTTDNDASNTIPNSYNLDVSCYSSETNTPYKNGINSIQDVTELATSVGTISLESNLFNSKETRIDNTNQNFLNTTIEEISQMASETSIPYPTITDTISTFTLESNMSSIVLDIPPLTPIPCLTQSSIKGASKTKNDNALDSLDTTCISKESCTINKLENQIATTETTLTNDKLIICNQYESSQSENTCDQHSNKTIIESIDKPTKCETLIEIAHPAHNAMSTKENIVNLALVQDITNSLSPVITIEQNNMHLLNNLETNTNITPVLEELCVKDFKVSEHISSANNNWRLNFIALSSDSFINIIPDLESNYSPVDNTMVDNQPKDQSVSTYVPTSITDKETEEIKEKEENEVTKMELDNKKEDSANYKIETDISVENDTTTANSEKLIKRVYEADRKCDISSLSENNLSIDYFTKSGLEIDFVTELPPLTNRFKIHPPSIKDTPKSKSLDNEILQDLCFTKLKKIKLNLVDSYSTEEVTDNKKEIDYTFKEHPFRNKSDNSENVGGRCYFSKILKSLSLESDVYEEVSRKSDRLSPALSQAALDIEEDSELIRRKLWAGVKSLSLDAEVLIATNKDQKSCVDISTSSMPALDESPTDGFKESGHGCTTHNEIGDPQSSLIKRFQKRRKSEAALKLMKENTKIIDQILNQRYDEWLENNFGAKNNYESHDENETKFLTRKSSSEHSISDYLSCDTNFTKLDATSKKQGINENQCKMINKIENTSVITSDKRSLSQEEILSNYTDNDLYSSKDVITFVQSQCHEKNSFEKIPDAKFSHSMNMPASTYTEKEIIVRKDELQDMDHTRTSPLPLDDFNISPSEDNSLSPSKSCDNNEKHSSESSPVITSKYFSSILKPETGKLKIKLEGSESDSSCPKTKPASFNNVALEKKSASKPPSVTFSKLSKLSPKSSGKSSNDQLKSKKTISFHSIESNSKNDSGSTKLQTTKQSSLGKPQIKCPFPTKPIDRPPKDLGVKLGLYSATRFNNA